MLSESIILKVEAFTNFLPLIMTEMSINWFIILKLV